MSNVQPKQKRWLTISLSIMVFALVSFSMMPLISSFFLASNQTYTASSPFSSKLESEALGYQMVLQREPENQNALRGLFETELKLGHLEEAIAPLEQLAQLNPDQTDYPLLLAQIQEQIQDYEEASTTYQTLIAAHPEEMRALRGWIELLLRQNKSAEAIDVVQKQIEQTKQHSNQIDSTSLELLLAEIYVEQEQWDQALAIYDQAIQTNSQDFRPILAKALVLQQQQKPEAGSLFEEAMTLAPLPYKEGIKRLISSDQKGT